MSRRKADRFDEERGVNSINEMEHRYEPFFSDEQIRQNIEMDYRTDFWFDEKRKPVDVVYAWPTVEVYGRYNEGGIRTSLSEGWTPVPPERHPELVMPDIFNREDVKKASVIQVRGHILMERNREFDRIAKEKTERENIRALIEADAVEKYSGMSHYQIGVNSNVMHVGGQRHSFN